MMKSQTSGFRLKGRSAGRLAGAMGLLLALCLVVGGALPAYAAQPPQIPHGFYGDVSFDGTPVAEGTAVEAYVGGVPKESTTVDDAGKYSLLVSGTAGATVTFSVGGATAAQTAIWESGAVDELDLTVPGYDLTVASTAGGEVTDPGEDTFTYIDGTVVDLLADPDAGYQFDEWTGDTGDIDDADAADTFITMNGDYDITANFEVIPPVQYDLTVASTAGSAVTEPGEGVFPYDEGTMVDLLAVAGHGYQFVNWTGDTGAIDNADAADTFITMNGDYDITANFEEIPPPGEQKLIGADDATATGNNAGGYVFYDKWTAQASGTMMSIRVKSGAAGNVKVAIYTDNSGEPGSLLNAVNTSTPVTSGWTTIAFPATSIIQGTTYWLASASDVYCIGYTSAGGYIQKYKPATYSTFTFPGSAGTGFAIYPGYNIIAGWGSIVAPVPPDIPTRDCTRLTFKWNAATGATATKYYLQVNTNSGFTGTDMFNAEVGNVTSSEVTGLTGGTTYYWRVKAGNTVGWSGWSTPTGSMRCE